MQYPVDGYIRGFTHAFVIILFFLLGGGRLTSVIVWACLLYVLMWMKTASDEVMFCICLPLGSFKSIWVVIQPPWSRFRRSQIVARAVLEPLGAVLGAFGQLLGGFYERQNRYCVRGASSLTRRSGHGWILEAFWNQK